jgi:hypothetical protein
MEFNVPENKFEYQQLLFGQGGETIFQGPERFMRCRT